MPMMRLSLHQTSLQSFSQQNSTTCDTFSIAAEFIVEFIELDKVVQIMSKNGHQ